MEGRPPAPVPPLNGRACFIIAPAMEGTTTAPALESCHRQPWKERPPAPAPPLNGRACFIIAPAMEGTTTAPALESCHRLPWKERLPLQHQRNRSTGAPAASSRLPWKDYHRASFGELPTPAPRLNRRSYFIIGLFVKREYNHPLI